MAVTPCGSHHISMAVTPCGSHHILRNFPVTAAILSITLCIRKMAITPCNSHNTFCNFPVSATIFNLYQPPYQLSYQLQQAIILCNSDLFDVNPWMNYAINFCSNHYISSVSVTLSGILSATISCNSLYQSPYHLRYNFL